MKISTFIFVIIMWGLGLTGCQKAQVATAPADTINTQIPPRAWPEQIAYYPASGVKTKASYMRDPFESGQKEDGRFQTFTVEDVFVTLASPAIFLGNTAVLPAALAWFPPWQDQCNRSVYAPRHEAAYEVPANPTGMMDKETITANGCNP